MDVRNRDKMAFPKLDYSGDTVMIWSTCVTELNWLPRRGIIHQPHQQDMRTWAWIICQRIISLSVNFPADTSWWDQTKWTVDRICGDWVTLTLRSYCISCFEPLTPVGMSLQMLLPVDEEW